MTIRRLVPILIVGVSFASPASAQEPVGSALHSPQHGGMTATAAGTDVLEQARAAAFALGAAAETAPRQRSFERMITGMALAIAGGRLVWYRLEDKDCREPEGSRCAWVAGAGAAGLAVGVLLMTVMATVPAAPSVDFEPQPGGAAIRAVVGF